MENKTKFRPKTELKLMDQVSQVLRYHHYAYRTEQTYREWIIRFVKSHGYQKHPKDMGKPEIEAFLSHLATNRKVAASTQRQALIHLSNVKKLHEVDSDAGYEDVYLPEALAHKYRNASREFRWQYAFPAKKMSKDPRSDSFRRHHVLESGLQKAVKITVDRAGITKHIGTHIFRHPLA